MAQNSVVTIEFMSRNELIWAQYKANKAQIDNLYSMLGGAVEQVKQGKTKVKIQSTATSFDTSEENKQLAFKRSRQLVSLLSSKYKLAEENFLISNTTTAILNKPDVAIITLVSAAQISQSKSIPAAPLAQSTSTAQNSSTAKTVKTEIRKKPTKPDEKVAIPVEPEPAELVIPKHVAAPKNFLKPPAAPQSPQHKYSL